MMNNAELNENDSNKNCDNTHKDEVKCNVCHNVIKGHIFISQSGRVCKNCWYKGY